MQVIIGVDPHKASHTAVAIGDDERELGSVKVRATRRQLPQLLSWAEPFEKRTWAIESASGLGYLLAQQLVAAGETVVDVPATLASRARLLATGRSTLSVSDSDRIRRSPSCRVPIQMEPSDDCATQLISSSVSAGCSRNARRRNAWRPEVSVPIQRLPSASSRIERIEF